MYPTSHEATVPTIMVSPHCLRFLQLDAEVQSPVAVVDGVGGALFVDRVSVPVAAEEALVLHATQDVHQVVGGEVLLHVAAPSRKTTKDPSLI